MSQLLIAFGIVATALTPTIAIIVSHILDRDERKAVAEKVEVVQERLVEQTRTTNAKLDEIHGLVNSNVTTLMETNLDALQGQLSLMREVQMLNATNGRVSTPESLEEMEMIEKRIQALKDAIAIRSAKIPKPRTTDE